ncbi:MAG: hypothetical protein H0V64_13830 [Geodermatophilaceae bacterium]|nr:hypothetical protein [Geodermatophilaceae bacterium]
MSTTAAGDGSGQDQDRAQSPKRRGLLAAAWLLPVSALVIGVLIGFVIWGTTNNDDSPTGLADTTPALTSSAPTGESAGTTVTVAVPQSCLDGVDESMASLDLLDQATQAISELDAARLQTIVDDLQSASERIRDLGEECRAATDVTVEDTTASPTS